MPDYLKPGLYVAETAMAPAILGAPVDTAAFAGRADPLVGAPPLPPLVDSAAGFAACFETADSLADGAANYLWAAVRGFFENGGARLGIVATAAGASPAEQRTAIASLAGRGAAIIAAPDLHAQPEADAATAALIAAAGHGFAILDPPPGLSRDAVLDWRQPLESTDAALYWPWLRSAAGIALPPSGHIAGIFARTAIDRGVWNSPANAPIAGIAGFQADAGEADQQLLNPQGINVLRSIPGHGPLVWGARTLSRQPGAHYIGTRRLELHIKNSVVASLAWTVFEANAPPLWLAVQGRLAAFLHDLWNAGALAGNRPEVAFFARCDRTTMTQDDVNSGRLVARIGIAPQRPGEFVVFRVVLATADQP